MWDKGEDTVGWSFVMAGEGYGRKQLCFFADVMSESF
jgi:hypothetical protein